jgi:hypothetical protein
MMPTSTTAPKTGRDISKRVLLALLVAFATLPATVPARAQTPIPVPVPVQPPPGQMGYYMMQGTRIIGGPYTSGPECMKAVTALMKQLPGNIAPIVCAHRRP